MSWLSKLTGVGISKKGVKIDPLKAALTALTVGTGGLGLVGKLGMLKGAAGALKGGPGYSGMDVLKGAALKAKDVVADPSRFRSIGGFLGRNKDSILDYGQAAEGVYDKYRDVQDYNRRKPLRDAGMAGLLDTSRPDLSGIFADPNDPNGRYRSVNVGSRGRY